jgi:hypothetical protein
MKENHDTNKFVVNEMNVNYYNGALVLIDMLFAMKSINKATYDNIKSRYPYNNERNNGK